MTDRIRYVTFFIALSALCFYYGITNESPVRWLLLWPTLSCLVLAFAYGRSRPDLVCGKDASGRVSILLLAINLPWLVFTWTVWLLTVALSREPSVNLIVGTNISISRYPLFGVDLTGYDRIFDLTAEFPLFYSHSARYQCFPNLDGVGLHDFAVLPSIGKDEKVLVHCAQGHGRSATFTSLLLSKGGKFETPRAVHRVILQARPGARLSRSQIRQLEDFGGGTSD